MKEFRIVDANINRVSEGLRVIEDINRFVLENKEISKEARTLRHRVRKTFDNNELILYRNSKSDIGLSISKENNLDKKDSTYKLLVSNFKRAQEGLRSIEESLKILGYYKESKEYEEIRFSVYELEARTMFKRNILNTDIYAILGEEFSNGKNNIEVVKELIEADVKIIQYREKNKPMIEKYKECLEIRKLTKESNVTFIVNDDISLGLAVQSDGIHIGQDDMPITEVKRLAPNMIIGLSTHNEEQAKLAVKQKADYIGVGPIFKTKTKKNIEKSKGLEYLKWVSENLDIPYVAIGGINEDNIQDVKNNGAYCYAMISEIVQANNIKLKINSIRNKIN